MNLKLPIKIFLSSSAVAAMLFCMAPDANAQGFRIGNFFQAGGGQGFRLGGQRAGMHFGGGQGTTIGTQRLGMRFGNGQGARFGGQNYGMQFGGQQGTQFGQFRTTPTVTPGTYYYGNSGYAQPVVGQYRTAMIPAAVASPNGGVAQTAYAAPTLAGPVPTIAPATLAGPEPTIASATAAPANADPGLIRLRYPADATDNLEYSLNGSASKIAPGETVVLTAGQEWNVQFSAGENFGERVASLSDAEALVFQKTNDEGWVLVGEEGSTPEETQVFDSNTEAPQDGASILNSTTETEEIEVDEPAPAAPTEQPAQEEPPAKVEETAKLISEDSIKETLEEEPVLGLDPPVTDDEN